MKGIELLLSGGWLSVAIIVIVVVILGAALQRLLASHKYKSQQDAARRKLVKVEKNPAKLSPLYRDGVLGNGAYNAAVIRQGQILDFTTIGEPIGTLITLSPTCPQSGGHYLVREDEEGKIVDFDHRDIPVDSELTPFRAWDTVNCRDEIVPFWTEDVKWWEDMSNWLTWGVLFIVFIATLAFVGGG